MEDPGLKPQKPPPSAAPDMDKKRIALLTLCDLSKAFDSVSHNILLEKSLNTTVDKFWFDNYLSGRSHAVRVNDTVSTKTDVMYGVPQGSISDPILFNIYVNDLSSNFNNCTLVQYAGDTQFLHTGTLESLNNLISNAEHALKAARTYFLKNGLKLNAKKTQCIFLGTRQIIPKIPENTTLKFHENLY